MKTFFAALAGSALGSALLLLTLALWADADSAEPEAAAVSATAVESARGAARPHPEVVLRLEGLDRLRVLVGERERAALEPARSESEAWREVPPDPNDDGELAAVDPASEIPELVLRDGTPDYPYTSAEWEDGRLMYLGQQARDGDGEYVRHGRWESWHDNGEREELGAYHMGAEHGAWEWWYANGNRMATGQFERGERIGDWEFWSESGRLAMTGSYGSAGNAVGTWTYYHENGRKASEGEMVAGAVEGRWTAWNEDGSINSARSGVYRDGERVGP